MKNVEQHKEIPMESEAHHALVRKIARESMVLLKIDGILPLSKTAKIAIIGDMAVNLRYQGGGSSHVELFKCDDLLGSEYVN